MTALKPCPFCKSCNVECVEQRVDDEESFCNYTGHRVECRACNAQGPWSNSKEEAEEKWNTRLEAPQDREPCQEFATLKARMTEVVTMLRAEARKPQHLIHNEWHRGHSKGCDQAADLVKSKLK